MTIAAGGVRGVNAAIASAGAMPEMLTSIHRAGADVILTYFAKKYAQSLQ